MEDDQATGPAPAPVPEWAYAPIVVVDADPGWSTTGRRLAAQVDELLASWRVGGAEHVGSTSVPGLAAKPVIDLVVEVADLDDVAVISSLTSAGWAFVPPELDGRAWERFFVLPHGAQRLAHLHVMGPAAARAAAMIRFRDALRGDPALRDGYAELKRSLADAHADDREAYTRAKAAFVEAALTAGER